MSTFTVCSAVILVLIGAWSAGAVSVERLPRQTNQQGASVLFFTAHRGSLRDIEYNPVIFDQVLVNQGSGYSNQTGVFTAPVTGIYQFVFVAQLCRGEHNNRWGFMVRDVWWMSCHGQVSGGDTSLTTCYLMEELKKGDQVWIKQNPGSCAWASASSKTITFSGVLLASEGVSTLGQKYGGGGSCPRPAVGSRLKVSSSAGLRAARPGVLVSLLLAFIWINF